MLTELGVKISADEADLDAILALAADTRVSGFTTNPTLMWKAGLTDYECQGRLKCVPVSPVEK